MRAPSRWGVLVGVLALLLLLGGWRAWSWWGLALSAQCPVIAPPALSTAELLSLKQRFDAYGSGPPDGVLVLTGSELSLLLDHKLPFPVAVEAQGRTALVRAGLPREAGGCYGVDFAGTLSVQHSVATLVPERLRVGELDLGAWLAGFPSKWEPRDLSDEAAALLLENTAWLEVRDGRFHVRLHNRRVPL